MLDLTRGYDSLEAILRGDEPISISRQPGPRQSQEEKRLLRSRHKNRAFIEVMWGTSAEQEKAMRRQADGLLGHKYASKLFKEWVPDLADKLLTMSATSGNF